MKKLTLDEISSCIQNLNIYGYAVVPGMLDAEEVAEYKVLTDAWKGKLKGQRYPDYSEHRPNDDQIFNLQAKEKRYIDLLTDPSIEAILRAQLNDPYYGSIPDELPNYILGEYICRTSGDALKLHIDSWIPSLGTQSFMMQVVFALDDRAREDGCSTVVPGSHRSGQYTDRGFTNVTHIEAKAGDVIIWDSRLWHGAAPNLSGKKATVLIATVQMWWVKQRFDIPHALPENIRKTLNNKEKALLGMFSTPPLDEFHGTNMRKGYSPEFSS
jgi:hypothetical protein